MNLESSIRLGRIRGIEIRLHWSWLLILGFLTWSLAGGLFGAMNPHWSRTASWLAALGVSLLFFISILVHELAHSLVAESRGMPVQSITLFVFGGVSSTAEEMRNPGDEFRIAIAGPLTSWLLAVLFGALWYPLRNTGIAAGFGYLAATNFVLGAFNLLPGFPLDGGRVFRSIVWHRTGDLTKATHAAATVGSIIAFILIGGGLLDTIAYGLGSGLWYVLVGLFLNSAARASYEQTLIERVLRDVHVEDVMRAPPEPVAPAMTIQRLVDDRLLTGGERAFLVAGGTDGHIAGLITATDIAGLPREQWHSVSVQSAMTPVERVVTIAPLAPALEALRLMGERHIHELPVIQDGRLLGMLTAADLLQQVSLRTQFASRDRQTAVGGSRR